MVTEYELNRNQLERLALEFQAYGIDELQVVGSRQRPPRLFLGREIQIDDGPVLRQVQPALPPAHLLKLLLRNLSFFEQQIGRFFGGSGRDRVHRMGTSISVFLFNGRMLVRAAGLVKMTFVKLAWATYTLVATSAPIRAV